MVAVSPQPSTGAKAGTTLIKSLIPVQSGGYSGFHTQSGWARRVLGAGSAHE